MKKLALNDKMKCSDTLARILDLNKLDIEVYKKLLQRKKTC